MKFLVSLASFFLLVAPAFAQHEAHRAGASKPATLLPGMGDYHFPIAAKNPEAQKYFDQGITLIYAFNHDEAARSFRRAAELDPAAAMPHWGVALSLGANYNDPVPGGDREKAAYEEIQKAQSLAADASARERAYIEALAHRYSADSGADRKKLGADYSAAMRQLVERYPDDLDAATLYAESLMNLRPWQLWDAQGNPAPGTEEIVRVLESVMRRRPNHPGANHYYIHAVEASKNPERALPSARRLLELVPGAGHLVHMPSHILFQLGDYGATALANEHAAAADEKFIELTGRTAGLYPLMYYSHNLHFIAVSHAELGHYGEAKPAAAKLAAHVAPAAKEMAMLQGFLAVPFQVALRCSEWDAALALPLPGEDVPFARAFAHYARAVALLEKGQKQPAAAEREKFLAVWKSFPADQMQLEFTTAGELLKVADAALQARFSGDPRAEVEAWRQAVALQDALNYGEPPPWYYPTRESLGAALLRAGQPAEAEKVFRENLVRWPRSARSLFGLWHSLTAQDQAEEAALVQQQFEEAWKGATTKLRLEGF